MNALMRSVMPEFAKEEPALDDDITSQCDFDCETGRRTADECWKEIHTFFRKTKPKVKQLGEVDVREIDVISYYMTCLDALISFLVETTMPMEDKKRYFREYQQDIRDFIADYDTRTGHGNTLNNALEELAFFPNAYALFDTAEEKIDFIFRLVVARHCTAFLHSLMCPPLRKRFSPPSSTKNRL